MYNITMTIYRFAPTAVGWHSSFNSFTNFIKSALLFDNSAVKVMAFSLFGLLSINWNANEQIFQKMQGNALMKPILLEQNLLLITTLSVSITQARRHLPASVVGTWSVINSWKSWLLAPSFAWQFFPNSVPFWISSSLV